MRTTLDLPDETFRQLKSQAALSGLKLKELVTQLIQRGLAAGVTATPSQAPQSPFSVATERVATVPSGANQPQSYPIPIAREADGSVTPALSNAQLYAILDKEDLIQYRRVLNGANGQ